MLYIILIVLGISILLLLCKEINIRQNSNSIDFINREISPKNKILFIKLQKEYLNNCSNDDILELCSFLEQYYLKRCNYENTK